MLENDTAVDLRSVMRVCVCVHVWERKREREIEWLFRVTHEYNEWLQHLWLLFRARSNSDRNRKQSGSFIQQQALVCVYMHTHRHTDLFRTTVGQMWAWRLRHEKRKSSKEGVNGDEWRRSPEENLQHSSCKHPWLNGSNCNSVILRLLAYILSLQT